jgi:hypothetical protein
VFKTLRCPRCTAEPRGAWAIELRLWVRFRFLSLRGFRQFTCGGKSDSSMRSLYFTAIFISE